MIAAARRLHVFAALAVSAACGADAGTVDSDAPDSDTDVVTPDSDDDTTDTDTPDTDPSAEDCANGADDDLDGLADCRDADCLTSSACVEQDCEDGQDNDRDGAVDCDDDDCWRHDCGATVTTTVTTGTLSWAWDSTRNAQQCTGAIYSGGSRKGPVRLLDASGSLVVHSPGGGVASACTWTVDHATQSATMVRATSSKYPYAKPGADRTGFQPGPGCPRAQVEDVFPPWVIPEDDAVLYAPTSVGTSWGQRAKLDGVPHGFRPQFLWASGTVEEVEQNRHATRTESQCYVPTSSTAVYCECWRSTLTADGYTRWTNLHTTAPVARPLPWVP